jgi:hypothetical protein
MKADAPKADMKSAAEAMLGKAKDQATKMSPLAQAMHHMFKHEYNREDPVSVEEAARAEHRADLFRAAMKAHEEEESAAAGGQ